MSTSKHEPEPDDFEVEISAVSADDAAPRGTVTRLSLRIRLSRTARAQRIGVVVSAFLVLLVVLLASLPELRNPAVGWVTRFIPTPTATLPPGADRFYLSADVPWTTITLDGQPIQPPRIGIDAPLQLARGHHMLTWRADPFTPQQCSLDVPPTTASSCTITEQIRQGKSGPLASVVALGESLTTLSAYQAHLLSQTIQAALYHFSAIIQPGEAYVNDLGTDTSVTQPLLAMLDMQIETDTDAHQSCSMSLVSLTPPPCAIEDQSCPTLCTVPWQDRQTAAAAPAAQDWLAFAVIHSSWDYATLDGQSIARNQPLNNARAPEVYQPILLQIGWDGSSWQVQPLFGPEQGSPIVVDGVQVADDPGCLAAEDVFSQEIVNFARLHFVSGPNPAVGCLVEGPVRTTPIGTPPPANAPVAYYLVRFGVYLSVNALAHQLDHWPLADAYEQQLAQELATLPGGLTVTPP